MMTLGTTFTMARDALQDGAQQTRRKFTAGAAAALMAFTAAVVPFVGLASPAQADQVSVLKGKIRVLEAHTRAMNKAGAAADARGAAADARGAAADARGAAADKVAGCYDYLIKGIKAGKIDRTAVQQQVGGKPLRGVACKIAASFGYNA